MKTKKIKFLALMVFTVIIGTSARGEDLRRFISLSGYWKFSIGDDNNWASPQYDDSKWDQLSIPGRWESQGYDEYNGYAWYRKTFQMGEIPDNTPIYLVLGRIDDADVVYINGKVLGKSGNFPPNFETAYSKRRKYTIPAGFLKINAENIIAVKVYDTYSDGGIVEGPIGLFFDADNELIDLNLSGNKWRFHMGDNKDWKLPDFKDESWKAINVPSEWENEGYSDYDGYAWYRIKFKSPRRFSSGNVYLSLGKIDDVDDVYLNGKFIGNVYDLKKDADYRYSGWEFNARRIYKIPEGLLNPDSINTLAIRVYDGQGVGGIYEGPVGIMSAENYRIYRNKHYSRRSFWDYIYDKYIRD